MAKIKRKLELSKQKKTQFSKQEQLGLQSADKALFNQAIFDDENVEDISFEVKC